MYRVNGFRVAQMRADASPRDLARRLEKLALQAKLGTPAESHPGPLTLNPPPEPDAVRQALLRLGDPEQRLLDEFFWFWPEQAGSGAVDAALEAVERGDLAAARKLWQAAAMAVPPSGVASHNLAVLAHILALDFEQRSMETGRLLDSVLCRMRDQAWAESYKHWKAVLEQPAFWDCFQTRILALDEPQLPVSLAQDLRQALPVALLSLNAQLAVQWATRRLPREVKRHQELMMQAGFDPLDAEEAMRRALRHLRARIKTLCETAAQSGTLASWQTALELFHGVADLPSSAIDRANLLEDTAPALFHICWFCQKQASQPGSAAAVPMHGRLTRTRSASGESVHWDRQVIDVPRCWQCAQLHQRWDILQAVGSVPTGIRAESEKDGFPFVARHLAEGWRLGVAPEGL
jgi:hypothetical protein